MTTQPCVGQKPPVHGVGVKAVPSELQACSVLPLQVQVQVRVFGVQTRGSGTHWPWPAHVAPTGQDVMIPGARAGARAALAQYCGSRGCETQIPTH